MTPLPTWRLEPWGAGAMPLTVKVITSGGSGEGTDDDSHGIDFLLSGFKPPAFGFESFGGVFGPGVVNGQEMTGDGDEVLGVFVPHG